MEWINSIAEAVAGVNRNWDGKRGQEIDLTEERIGILNAPAIFLECYREMFYNANRADGLISTGSLEESINSV